MPQRVLILAQDLVWSDRLARAVQAAGATPVRVATTDRFATSLAAADAAIVDLTAHAYDGVAAIGQASAAAVHVLAVGQHDDRALRKRALDAGAYRVLAYRKLFEDGPASVAAFLAGRPEVHA